MIIAIPSKNRAGRTTSQNVLPNATFFVPNSEVHQYKAFVKNIIGIPNNIQGITPTRNWILKNTKEKYVVFIDDDVKTCGYNKLLERNTKKIEIKNEEFWNEEFKKFFMMCEELEYKMWGVRTESSPRGTYPYKPILFRTYLTASCMGMINDGEYYFNEKYKVKEDYEICLRHIRDKGGILGIRYLHWENEHWTTEGGCKDYRTIEIERDCIKRLIKEYPNMVLSAKRKNNEFCIKLNV
tara:strand:- start:345 stop:1061 length:717 start_codon:yes stop_codon:yes gene_type:complete